VWGQKRWGVANDEERPLLAGEVGSSIPNSVVNRDPLGASLAGGETVARE